MALDIANEFLEMEDPSIVRYIDGSRMAHEVYRELMVLNQWVAILFNEYWRSYKITGNIPQPRGF